MWSPCQIPATPRWDLSTTVVSAVRPQSSSLLSAKVATPSLLRFASHHIATASIPVDCIRCAAMATAFLATQAPCALTSVQATVAAPAGLRRPASRTALKSPFQSGGGALAAAVAGGLAAPSRLSMRAAAKAAYICTDCGYVPANAIGLQCFSILVLGGFSVVLD